MDQSICGPLRHAVEVGMSPPALDFVRSERSEDALGRRTTSAVAMIVPPPPSAMARGARHFAGQGVHRLLDGPAKFLARWRSSSVKKWPLEIMKRPARLSAKDSAF
jgi:hypothetical protein